MFTTKKIALGVGGTLIVLASGLGVATLANAETTGPTPNPSPTQAWQGGGYGRMGGGAAANPNAGLRNGAGYGASENAEYLAGNLGVTPEAVTAALQKYHATNPVLTRGRDLTADQQAAEHAKLAAFLATELKVDQAKALDALNNQDEVRQADRTADLKANLDEAVKAGRLTQAQADAILEAHEAGAMGGGRGGGMGRGPRR